MAATRHSGLECLRIISIILIVSMHILGNTFHTSNWLNKEFILFINTLGNTGVTLFILISGYFGIRFNTHKFFKMLVGVWFYSIVSYLIETIWLHTCLLYTSHKYFDGKVPVCGELTDYDKETLKEFADSVMKR